MRIVILGAGQVGGTLAQSLVSEDNDITLIDLNEARLQELQHRMDIQTIHGSASHPDVLLKAGIEQADMLIAVTDSDEINMIACQIAHSLFHTPTKIARIRSKSFYQHPMLFSPEHIPVDFCISPEALVTEHIENLIHYPGTASVLDFADKKVLLVTIKPVIAAGIEGNTLGELQAKLKQIEARVVALLKHEEFVDLNEDIMLEQGDEVLFIASPAAVEQALVATGRNTHPNKRIMIAGGGHIGSRLALQLEQNYKIKVIDQNPSSTEELAELLQNSTVLQGDIADRELLRNENIEFTDVFCAVTNDDEANIMSCLLAKRLGVRHTMALVNRKAYVELIDESNIDYAISPQLITIGSILRKMRRGNMRKIYRLQNNEGEAMEIVLYGNQETSNVVGRRLNELTLPPCTTVAALVRNEAVMMVDEELVFKEGDSVIVLLFKKRYLRQLEALFQVKLNFMG